MNRYRAFLFGELKESMIYRMDFILSFAADFILIFVKLAVWMSVYKQRSIIAGFTFPMMMTYLFVSQIVSNIYTFKNDASRPIGTKIHKGTIAFDLLRPVEFTKARLFENLGQTIPIAIFGFISLVLFATILPSISMPGCLSAGLLFILSIACSYWIMFSVNLISGLLSFWLMNNWGLRNIRMAIISFFSGSLVPIPMLPEWMQRVCQTLPFQSIVYTPTMIYMGEYAGEVAWIQIGIQVFWAGLLWVSARMLCRAALKKVSINGG